jgi:chromosome segregation ATPase
MAALRTDRLGIARGYLDNLESLDIAIKRFQNQIQVLETQKQDCVKSAKAFSAAYLGLPMPKSISDELTDRTKQLQGLDNRIKEINDTITGLNENRSDAEVECRNADQAVADMEEELRQVDRRITEIRGF